MSTFAKIDISKSNKTGDFKLGLEHDQWFSWPYLYSEKLTFYPASHELSPQDTVILYNLIDILQKDTSKYTQICGYIDTSEHPSDYRRSCLSYDRGWNVAHHLMRRGISRDRIEVWISTGAPSSIKRMRIEIAQR